MVDKFALVCFFQEGTTSTFVFKKVRSRRSRTNAGERLIVEDDTEKEGSKKADRSIGLRNLLVHSTQ